MSLFYEDLLCLLKTSSAEGPEILESEVSQTYKPFQHVGDSVAHAHWVGSLDNSSHATKGKKCANGTGSLITLNCGKGVNHCVTCTSIFLVLRSFTVESQLAVLSTTRSL